jgi:hypothetical protein
MNFLRGQHKFCSFWSCPFVRLRIQWTGPWISLCMFKDTEDRSTVSLNVQRDSSKNYKTYVVLSKNSLWHTLIKFKNRLIFLSLNISSLCGGPVM